MSNRRRRKGRGWTPYEVADPPTVDQAVPAPPTPDDEAMRLAERISTGVAAAVNALTRAGACDISHGWVASAEGSAYAEANGRGVWRAWSPEWSGTPGPSSVPHPSTVAVWWFHATMPDGTTVEGRSEPTTNHPLAILDAVAVILRGAGRIIGRVYSRG